MLPFGCLFFPLQQQLLFFAALPPQILTLCILLCHLFFPCCSIKIILQMWSSFAGKCPTCRPKANKRVLVSLSLAFDSLSLSPLYVSMYMYMYMFQIQISFTSLTLSHICRPYLIHCKSFLASMASLLHLHLVLCSGTRDVLTSQVNICF